MLKHFIKSNADENYKKHPSAVSPKCAQFTQNLSPLFTITGIILSLRLFIRSCSDLFGIVSVAFVFFGFGKPLLFHAGLNI